MGQAQCVQAVLPPGLLTFMGCNLPALCSQPLTFWAPNCSRAMHVNVGFAIPASTLGWLRGVRVEGQHVGSELQEVGLGSGS